MTPHRKQSLLRLIPIAILLIVTIVLSSVFYQNLMRNATDDCWDSLAVAHSESAREIGAHMKTNQTILQLAADAIVMNTDLSDEDTVQAYLQTVQAQTMFDRIGVIFPDGYILSQTGECVPNTGSRSFEELIAQDIRMSTRVADFLDPSRQVLHMFAPVYDEQSQPIAILAGTLYCSTLADTFGSAHYGEEVQMFLVDMRDGSIVLDRYHDTPGSIHDMQIYNDTEEDVISDMLGGGTGTISYASKIYYTTSYTYYAPVPQSVFSLTMVIQEDVAFADVYELRDTLLWVGVIELTLLILFAAWIYSTMLRTKRSENRAREAELALLHQKEQELQRQYNLADDRRDFLELMAINLPGGYHRCTTDHEFRLTFASRSFTQVTGYTMEQLQAEHDGSYFAIVADEDKDIFMGLAPDLERDGYIHCAYRIRRRDGELRWVQDTTQYVEREGEKFYQCALMDITEQIEQLERAKGVAEESSRAKSTFLFNMSHDIRTPMNAIRGFSRIISENVADSELVARTIAKLDQASESLMMLINDVLDISRIERGKEELTQRPLSLRTHRKLVYEMFSSEMQQAGIEFTESGEDIDDIILCDELKLTRIVMNMLSNAKKFTKAGGSVSFGVTRVHSDAERGTYRFFVRDSGIGMSPAFLERAFEQFERERTSTQSGVSGSGLGLSIIKMLTELMGGEVDIQSEQGRGTEIGATISFSLVDADTAPHREKSERTSADMQGKRVLLVEDNAFNREIATYLLQGMGLLVEEAQNGAEALQQLQAQPADHYDLIFMDIQMPVMDGYAATEAIRALPDPQRASIPIVAMTANAFEEDRRKCLQVGMNDHIGKPLEIDDLRAALQDVFS